MTIFRFILMGTLFLTLPAFVQGETQPPTEQKLSNKIKWRTSSEEKNFGFNVYRATAEDGPFEKLNGDPIEGGGTTDTPRNYVWEDDTIEANQGYYYYVESISLEGVRERFTPIIFAKPKQPK